MTVAKTQKNPQPLRLDISNANLHITPEQFDRLCIDNPDLKLELTADGQLILMPTEILDERVESLDTADRPIAQSGSATKYDFPELTPAETARRVAAIERFNEHKRQLWDSLTPEEKAENDRQFAELYKSLEESRR